MFQGRSPHHQQSGQDVDEDSPDPGRHSVGLWGSEVDVENHHSDADTEGVEDHGEEDKLAEEGDHEGGRGDDLRQQEEEHGEREQDGDGEADLETPEIVLCSDNQHNFQLTAVPNILSGKDRNEAIRGSMAQSCWITFY